MITALFEFTRSLAPRSAAKVTASVDAQAVLLNWAMSAPRRAYQPVLDLPHLLVAELTWDEHHDTAHRNDLDSWAQRLDVSVSSALRMSQVDRPVARPLAA